MEKIKDEIKKDPTRDGFGRALVELGHTNPNVVALSADLTDSTRAGWFKKEFPDRFFCFGVAEQNMISAAAGMALCGKIPFASTFGVFAAGRAWDQVRVSVDYMELNIKIVGTHGGISVGEDGYTHQALEEIALMRVLPNMTVIVPCDAFEAKKATCAAAAYSGPVYIRLGRNACPLVTTEEDIFEIGKGIRLTRGNDVTIVACGQMVYEAMKAAEILEKENIGACVLNLHTVKPIDRELLIDAARRTGAIVTVEEHSINGGLGSAVAEALATAYPVPLRMMGLDECTQSGSPQELFACYRLQAHNIAQAAKDMLLSKKKHR